MSDLSLNANWFSDNVPQWLAIFKNVNIEKMQELRILEIGSFEGLSALFLLENFPKSIITCVDPWEYEESIYEKNSIEKNFDSNTKLFENRIKKI